jgi:sorting nexin-9/18/33
MGKYNCTNRYVIYAVPVDCPRVSDSSAQILSKLKAARGNFDEPLYGSLAQTSRQPSIFERELENPRLTSAPLTQPTPHVFDSAPMRPVSVAIQEGVGLFLNAPRSSVFGKFW